MKAVFLDVEGLEDCNLNALNEICGSIDMYPATQPDELASRIDGAEIIILNKVKIDSETLQSATALKLICVVATGVDVVDLKAAKEAGVTVCNCQAYGIDSVVQHVFSSILALHTSLLQYNKAVGEGRWQTSRQFCFLDYPIIELKGKKLGIIGYGNLGKGVAKIAEAFGMEVLVGARPGATDDSRMSIDELLAEADVITLHCPLNDATRNLIDEAALARMKPTAFLVNAARGGIVDEIALAAALKNGIIAGAAFDVLTVEPPKDGNPLLNSNIPNLIVTPHVAWASKEARQRIIAQTVENIKGYISKSPLRVVNG
ncbi:D-2-hydroxyacid dehydrogenase [Desulfosediminicola flagellatus]|uniref:D-2-hydroxyacid dehydrogenase n=1 Tax=Desulfosediminicola flagellatus TaxID=2569541 RepID=UPI0010AC1652|nr:D-2-hydroxyacid dehydrogenase [Desulfosediminicola flagellatus]